MKKLVFNIIVAVLLFGCNSEDANNCFQTVGTTITEEISVNSFNKILVNERIKLIIKEGDSQKVEIETGENLLNDISAEVSNNTLILTNNNTCNFVRDYGITKITVTTDVLNEIRNSSEQAVRSEGILTFNSLKLISDNFQSDYINIGDFHISVNNANLEIISNGISNFYIDGTTTNFNVGFFAADSRLEAKNLLATNINITHKSSNDMLVNPQEKITGNIYSIGDVIAYNQPTIVAITEHYEGKLIFE